MSRWKCVCAYDGGGFSGWQSQPRGDSVQDAIEARLGSIFAAPTRIHASGRTDAGVHARGQVFHFDGEWTHGGEKLAAAMAHRLPRVIQIVSVVPASAQFHARFSAKGKIYAYHIRLGDADPFTRPFCWSIFKELDLSAMRSAAAVLRGRHDFRAFAAMTGDEAGDAAGAVRTLRRLDVRSRGRNLTIVAEADGFLYKMVRSLVGTLVGAAEGKISQAEIRAFLKSGTRTARIQTAPAHGLFLQRVLYR